MRAKVQSRCSLVPFVLNSKAIAVRIRVCQIVGAVKEVVLSPVVCEIVAFMVGTGNNDRLPIVPTAVGDERCSRLGVRCCG